MKLKQDQTLLILDKFEKLKTKDDFLNLLNIVKGFIYGSKANPFELRQLNYYINVGGKSALKEKPDVESKHPKYLSFNIAKKKKGEFRTIHAPNHGLQTLQSCLNIILQTVHIPHKAATGFVKNKSIVDNAKIHAGSIYVYNIDLKDFFLSIDKARIWKRLQLPPFNLNSRNGSLMVANMISAICCYEIEVERNVRDGKVVPFRQEGTLAKLKQSVLPQGAPTSPIITNIVCEQLDHRLNGVAKRFGLRYSRYADDITFSSSHNIYKKDSDFILELHRIIADQNFIIKTEKTRLQKQGYRQEVTGLTVNQNPNVKSHYIKQLRKWIYLWERYGYEHADPIFAKDYINDKGNLSRKKQEPNMASVLEGKLVYLKMVKGSDSPQFKKLQKRFEKLTGQIIGVKAHKKITEQESKTQSKSIKTLGIETQLKVNPISETLHILASKGEEGLAEAMEFYSIYSF